MPDVVMSVADVERGESFRSDEATGGNQKPRVSFNRDVHVKRIGPRGVAASPNGSPKAPVRKQRLGKVSDEVLAREAAHVFRQADRVHCQAFPSSGNDKFFSLPLRGKKSNSGGSVGRSNSLKSNKPRASIFNIFKKPESTSQDEKLSRSRPVGRSKSDVSDKRHGELVTKLRNKTNSESEDHLQPTSSQKKQLSPIIETSPRDDYFGKTNPLDLLSGNKEFMTKDELIAKKSKSKENINTTSKKLKIDKTKQTKIKDKENINPDTKTVDTVDFLANSNAADNIKEPINILGYNTAQEKSEEMIHSSQKPTERPPLTKGNTVDYLVKKLSNETVSPLHFTNKLIAPGALQHNNNRPFSYTKPLITDDVNMRDYPSDNIKSNVAEQITYAQVICNNDSNGVSKQTVHTNFAKSKTNSDEDEGFGHEENRKLNARRYPKTEEAYLNLSDHNNDVDLPITPTLREYSPDSYNNKLNRTGYEERLFRRFDDFELPARGTADGMDAKRKESLTEPNLYLPNINDVTELSHRRDLLQSRINSRRLTDLNNIESDREPFNKYLFNKNDSLPTTTKYVTETRSQYYKEGSRSPIGFTEKIVTRTHLDDEGKPFTEKSYLKNDWPYNNLEANRKLFLESQINNDNFSSTYSPTFNYENFYEPRSLDSQISDNLHKDEKHSQRFARRFNKYSKDDRFHQNIDHYRSNPEIVSREDYMLKSAQGSGKQESYHNSLRRQNKEESTKKRYKYGDIVEPSMSNRKIEHDSRHFDLDREKKDRLVDSGIENDYRRDSNGENDFNKFSDRHYLHRSNEMHNGSEEDINSSLHITNETRNVDNDLMYHRDLDIYKYKYRSDDNYPHNETNKYTSDDGYKNYDNDTKNNSRNEFAYRERSIDDGSFYDSKLDEVINKKSTKLRRNNQIDKKTSNEDKKMSNLDKVRQLFSSKKQKKEKLESMVKEEDLRARYTEYKGSSTALDKDLENRIHVSESASKISTDPRPEEINDYGNRRRLSTPSPTRREISSKKNGGSWFRSLDRLTKHSKPNGKNKSLIETLLPQKYPLSSTPSSRNASRLSKRHDLSTLSDMRRSPMPHKNLRFFGDTDLESNASISKYKTSTRTRPPLDRSKNVKHYSSTQLLSNANKDRKVTSSLNALNGDSNMDGRKNLLLNSCNQEKFSNRNLRNISENHNQSETRIHVEEPMIKNCYNYRYGSNRENNKFTQNDRSDSILVKKPPMSPLKEKRENDNNTISRDTLSKMRKSKSDLSDGDYRRKRPDIMAGASSVESSTEGDSSQNSIVYLHAATVGDIPGPRRRNRRSVSREELSSINSSRLQPQVKTISRSISVLAPWKPRHVREGYDINYSQTQNYLTNGRNKSIPHNSSMSSHDSNQKYKLRNDGVDSKTLGRRPRNDNNEKHSSINTLYRKHRHKNSHESLSDRKLHTSSKSATLERRKIDNGHGGSNEALGAQSSSNRRANISRSISMPRDTGKSAGWFRMTKNSKKN